MSWTEEKVNKLKELWGKGSTASQIAEIIGGVSRNAVIGKIHRLGLSERGSKSNLSRAKKIDNKINDKNLTSDLELKLPEPDNTIEVSTPKKGKKRGRKPSIKNLNSNDYNSNLNSETNEKSSPDMGGVDNEIDKVALANMKEIEKKAKKLNLLELTEKTCKWPIGDPATAKFWFCGHPSEQGKPYCETHISIAFQPITTRRDKKQSKIVTKV